MFPPEVFGVGVTVAALAPVVWEDAELPAGVVSSRPSRLGDLLQVDLMTPEQKAAQLQRVEQAEAVLAAFKAELVVGLAADRPAGGDRQRGQTGAASGEWAAELLDADVSEFFPDELHRIVDLMRELRASTARRHVREEVPFYTGVRKSIAEIVADLA